MEPNIRTIGPYIRAFITIMLTPFCSDQINFLTSVLFHLTFDLESQIFLREVLRVESHQGLWLCGSFALSYFLIYKV